MRSSLLLVSLAAAVLVLSCAGFVFADDRWPELPYEPCFRIEREIQSTDVCPQGGFFISGYAINDHGTIVGTATCTLVGPTRAFIWRMNGPFQWIPFPPGMTRSWATQLNNDGWVAGRFQDGSVITRGYLWNEHSGAFHVIAPPEGFITVLPNGMNARGVVVGHIEPPLQPPVGFIWENGAMTLLPDLYDFGDRAHIAVDIDDAGSITGYFAAGINNVYLARPFLIENDLLKEIDHPFPGGWHGTTGLHLLPGGRFVGEAWHNPKVAHNTTIVFGDGSGYLGEYDRPDYYRRTVPNRSNSSGDIVGGASNFSNIWEPIVVRDGAIRAINDLLVDGAPFTALTARGVSENGQIATSQYHLVPAPPPLGDLNRNCRRDIDDLLLLLSQWGPGKGVPADLNNDGRVDLQDVLLMLNLIAEDLGR